MALAPVVDRAELDTTRWSRGALDLGQVFGAGRLARWLTTQDSAHLEGIDELLVRIKTSCQAWVCRQRSWGTPMLKAIGPADQVSNNLVSQFLCHGMFLSLRGLCDSVSFNSLESHQR
jgi:hypothetical protein